MTRPVLATLGVLALSAIASAQQALAPTVSRLPPDAPRTATGVDRHGERDAGERAARARPVAGAAGLDRRGGRDAGPARGRGIAHYLGTSVPSLPFEDRLPTQPAAPLPRGGRS